MFIISYILLKKIKSNTHKKLQWYKYIIYYLIVIIGFIAIRFLGVTTLEKCDSVAWDCYLFPRYYYDNFVNPKKSLGTTGLYEYTIRDVYFFIKDKTTKKISKEEVDKIIEKRNLIKEDNEYTGIFKNKNLIMIMLESIDNIVLNEQSMPTLMYMKENGWDFSMKYSQLSSGGATFASEFTSLTGLYNTRTMGYNNFNQSLPNVFKENGYSVSSVHENKSAFYNRNKYHKNFGFDKSYFLLDMGDDYKRFDDEQLVERDEVYNGIISKDSNSDNFMSYIITISAHGPYKDNYMCSVDKKYMESEYNCFSYLAGKTDGFLKLLLERLENDKLLDDTVILLYSDHFAYSYTYTDEENQLYNQVDDNYNIKNSKFLFKKKYFYDRIKYSKGLT